jgi:hypothetical protein
MRAFRLLTVSLISWASRIHSSRASISVSGRSKVFMSEGRDQKLLGAVNAGSAAGLAGVFLRSGSTPSASAPQVMQKPGLSSDCWWRSQTFMIHSGVIDLCMFIVPSSLGRVV